MSDEAKGGSNGTSDQLIRRKDLIDVLELTFDRADGSMVVGGRILNFELGLMIAQRAVNYFETLLRIQAAGQVQAQAQEAKRVAALLDRTRGGRV